MVILQHKDQYLMLKRSKNPNIGRLVPVGGKVDPHENPRSTAIREVNEEAGLSISEEDIVYVGGIIESAPNNYNWICFIYLCTIPHVEPPECDEGELIWIDKDQVKYHYLPDTDPWVYDYIEQGKPFMFNAEFDEALNMVSMVEEIENEKII